jgi:hypothetical protein
MEEVSEADDGDDGDESTGELLTAFFEEYPVAALRGSKSKEMRRKFTRSVLSRWLRQRLSYVG